MSIFWKKSCMTWSSTGRNVRLGRHVRTPSITLRHLKLIMNKPRTAQVGAISKAQKQQKDLKVLSILFCGTQKT